MEQIERELGENKVLSDGKKIKKTFTIYKEINPTFYYFLLFYFIITIILFTIFGYIFLNIIKPHISDINTIFEYVKLLIKFLNENQGVINQYI